MKKKYATVIAIALFTSTSVIYADIEIHQKNNKKYISIEEIADKLDMKLTAIENKITLQKNNKNIEIDINETFAKIGEKYVAIDTEVIDGYVVPKDTDIIIEKSKTYIPLAFVENNQIIDGYTPPTSNTRPPTGEANRPPTGEANRPPTGSDSNGSNNGENNNSEENEQNSGGGSNDNNQDSENNNSDSIEPDIQE